MTPTFSLTEQCTGGIGTTRGPLRTIRGTLVLDGSHGANPGDIPAVLFGFLETVAYVEGGFALNVGGTQAIAFAPAPGGASLLSLNSSGVPANAPADTYAFTVVGN